MLYQSSGVCRSEKGLSMSRLVSNKNTCLFLMLSPLTQAYSSFNDANEREYKHIRKSSWSKSIYFVPDKHGPRLLPVVAARVVPMSN